MSIRDIQFKSLSNIPEVAEVDTADKDAKAMRYNAAFSKRSADLDSELSVLIQKEKDEERKSSEAEKVVRDLQAQLDTLEQEEKTLEANAKANNSRVGSTPCLEYHRFQTTRAALLARLITFKAALKGLATGKSTKIEGTWLGTRLLDDEEWNKEAKEVGTAVDDLAAVAMYISGSKKESADRDVGALSYLWREVQELRPYACKSVLEAAAAADSAMETRNEITTECKRLLTWCRQQKTNLDAMVEPDHIQDFCASLVVSFPTMEENFSVLLEMSEPLLPDDAIQSQLLESNEVWLNLQIFTYDRLRHTLLELHPKSKLEDEVREFSSYSTRVGEFLETFSDLLAGPSDPESQEFVQPVMERCEALREDYGIHGPLSKQLHDFCLRMECLRESYANLRRAVLSRLTFLSASVPALTASMRRKEEYVARMKDLKKWVEVKSQGETWEDIHERIQSIKSLINTEQTALLEAKRIREEKERMERKTDTESAANEDIFDAVSHGSDDSALCDDEY